MVLPAFIAGLATGAFVVLLGTILGYRFAQVHDQEDDDA